MKNPSNYRYPAGYTFGTDDGYDAIKDGEAPAPYGSARAERERQYDRDADYNDRHFG